MADPPENGTLLSEAAPPDARLDSWKEIATYLGREIRTVQRWEKSEGLPVHRLMHAERGRVYAFTAELDAWRVSRRELLESQASGNSFANGEPIPTTRELPRSRPHSRTHRVLFSALALALLVFAWTNRTAVKSLFRSSEHPSRAAIPQLKMGRLLARSTQEGSRLTLLPVGSSPMSAVLASGGAEVYVSNMKDGTVSVIRADSNRVTHTLPVGGMPLSLVVSPGGKIVYAGNLTGGLQAIDTQTKRVRRIETGGLVTDLAITPDGEKLYLAMQNLGLKMLRTSTGDIIKLPVLACPQALAMSPDGNRLYVNYQCSGPGGRSGHDAIDVIDVATDRPLGTILSLPNVGGWIAASPDGAHVWANASDACSNPRYDHAGCPAVPAGLINILRTADHSVIRRLTTRPSDGVTRFTFLADSSRILLGGNRLQVVDSTSLLETESVTLGASGSVAVTADGSRAYAPVPDQNAVAVFDISARHCPAGIEPLVWWSADGSANDILGGDQGRIQGAAFAPGRVGQAFAFDGRGGYVQVGEPNGIFGGDFTVALWIKPSPDNFSSSPAVPVTPLLDRMTTSGSFSEGWRLALTSDQRIETCYGGIVPGGCLGASGTSAISRTKVASGSWTQVVASKAGGKLSLWLNGTLEAATPLKDFRDSRRVDVWIGKGHTGQPGFRGLVDEIQVFNGALTPKQVLTLFQPPPCQPARSSAQLASR